MRKKILMVYPEIPTTFWSFKYALPFIKCKSSMPPLGLLTVAALLPEGYDVKLIDMNVKKLTKEDIDDSDLVFISAMIIQKDSFVKAVKMCKDSGKPVVAGGPYPTSSMDEIKDVDYLVLNEAEITLPEFIKDYESGNPDRIYTSEIKPDITKTPLPRYDLVENVNDYTYLALQFSRGCPFNCEFCDIIEMFGRKHRSKNIDQFINEIQCVYDTGYRGSLFIVDDNFIGNKNSVKKLLRGIKEWQEQHNFPFSLFTEASINLAHDDEIMDLMVQSGFSCVFIGIETPDTETLSATHKSQNLREDIHVSVGRIQSHGLEVMGGFIVGFDTDPEDIFQKQIDFITQAGISTAMIGMLQALPKTQLYRRLKEEGRLTGMASGNNTHDLQLNFLPKRPADELFAGYKRIISEIYKPVTYFNTTYTLLKRLPSKRVGDRKVGKNEIKILAKSLVRQTFSKYSFFYVKFLLRVLIRKPVLFPLAINYAIRGHHFFRMTDEIIKAEEFSALLDIYIERLNNKLKQINFDNNFEKVYSIIEEYRIFFKRQALKKYRQMNYNLHNLLEEKLELIDHYCDSIIFKYKEKVNLLNTE
ncbi:MAG: B12-binding domain-containing radical SAM protein [Spirochaetes bacterium]|nr:B12-binding domain-containing radical SAM protein [Spirochaetota bacterium]